MVQHRFFLFDKAQPEQALRKVKAVAAKIPQLTVCSWARDGWRWWR